MTFLLITFLLTLAVAQAVKANRGAIDVWGYFGGVTILSYVLTSFWLALYFAAILTLVF